jgi:quercetin 2,3-dioxygenase
MKLHQDAVLYSIVLEPNMEFSHELGENRGAWLQVVDGEVRLGAQLLATGDGVGITAERVISVTAAKQTELFLLEIGQI